MKTLFRKYALLAVVVLTLGVELIAANPAEARIVYSGIINETIYPTPLTGPDFTIPVDSGYDLNLMGGDSEFNINVFQAQGTQTVEVDLGLFVLPLDVTYDGQTAGVQNLMVGPPKKQNYFVGEYTTIQISTDIFLYPNYSVDLPVINKLAKDIDVIGPGLPLLDQESELKNFLGFDVGGFEARVHLEGDLPNQDHGPFGDFRNSEGYAGFQFEDTEEGIHYGWLRVYLDYDNNTNTISSLTIYDYAYETTVGQSITVGALFVQVTDNMAFDVVPQVLEDGSLLWQGWDGHDYEIYYQEPGQDPILLTNNDSPDVMPQMNDLEDLVWMNWNGSNWEVCYDLGAGPVQLTDSIGYDVLPQITNDGLIYWQGWDGSDYELYCHNPATGETTQLTSNSVPDAAPQVNPSGQLTWMLFDGQDWEVCYDLGSGPVQLTNNTGQDLVPQITPEGEIYWQGWDGSDYEIYRYAFGSGLTENLTENTVDDTYPAVNNGILVWAQWDGQDYEIYRLIFDTGITTRLTDDEYDDQRPRLNNIGQIVWMKWDGNDYEVYAYK